MCLTQAADVFCTGVVAGGFLIGTLAIHPAAEALEVPAHLRLRQELVCRLSRSWPPFMLAPIVAAPLALIWCRTAVSVPVDAAGLVLSAATIGITLAVNAPLNRRLGRWTTDSLPHDWHHQVRRWNTAHSLRTATALGAFVCAIWAGAV
jgi:uncharacterized membrane protein